MVRERNSSFSFSDSAKRQQAKGQQQKQRPHQNDGNGQQKQRHPWEAWYHMSKQTQDRLHKTVKGMEVSGRRSNNNGFQWALTALQTLLNTDPVLCNTTRVVYALRLSAKLLEKMVVIITRMAVEVDLMPLLLLRHQ